MTEAEDVAVTLQDVQEARAARRDEIRVTPVLHEPLLDAAIGSAVTVKAEHLQRTGAFKFRGIYNAARQISAAGRPRLLTASSGNAALGLALAARSMGLACTVVMPSTVLPAKRDAVLRLGADVVDGGATADEVIAIARGLARPGVVLVHPYDDWAVIAGHGSIALEILEQVPDVARVIVPTSGGGLLSATGLVIKSLAPNVRVIGVQPVAPDSVLQSFRAGRVVPAQRVDTLADALVAQRCGERNLALISRHVDDVVTVRDDTLLAAMAMLWRHLHIAVEPAAAAPLAALLDSAERGTSPGRTVIVTTGSNVNLALLQHAVSGGNAASWRADSSQARMDAPALA